MKEELKKEEELVDVIERGNFRRIYRNGVRCSEFHVNENFDLDGDYKSYYEDGRTVRYRCTYKDGKLDGLVEDYLPDGTLWKTCYYNDGKRLERAYAL